MANQSRWPDDSLDLHIQLVCFAAAQRSLRSLFFSASVRPIVLPSSYNTQLIKLYQHRQHHVQYWRIIKIATCQVQSTKGRICLQPRVVHNRQTELRPLTPSLRSFNHRIQPTQLGKDLDAGRQDDALLPGQLLQVRAPTQDFPSLPYRLPRGAP